MISAIISTYNREKYLPNLLKSLTQQSIELNKFEIILINNNSTDNTESIALQFQQEHPEVQFHYFVEKNQGLSYARNRGIKESNGAYLTFIDDDAIPADDYLEKVVAFFNSKPDFVAVGSKILLKYEDVVPSWENKYLNSLMGFFDPGDEAFTFNSKNYPRGSNMSFRASIFEEVGDFNVNLGRVGRNLAGSEEKDLFNRIYNHGKKVGYIPDALVYHFVPLERTTPEFIKRQGIGTGQSERQRVKDEGGLSFVIRILIEFAKWGASLVLFVLYLFKGQLAKGKMIVKFRTWVSKGLFQKSK